MATGGYPQNTHSDGKKRKTFDTPTGLKISLCHCDIKELKAEAIVSVEDEHFDGQGNISKLLLNLGGESYTKERDKLKWGPNKVRKVYEQDTKKCRSLNYYYVLHAISPRFDPHSLQDWEKSMRELYRNILKKGEQLKLKKIILPLLGTGKEKAPIEKTAGIAVEELFKFKTDEKPHIFLVTLDDVAFIYLLSNCEYHEKENNAVKSGTGRDKQSGSGTGRKLDTGTTTESDTDMATGGYPENTHSDEKNRKTFDTPTGLKISLCHCDIKELNAEAIVSVEGEHFKGQGNISKLLLNLGGEPYKKERDKLKRQIKVGNVYEQDTKKCRSLKYSYVLHAISPRFDPYSPKDWEKSVRELYRNILKKGEELKLKKIILPLLGTGERNYQLEKAAGMALEELFKFKTDEKPHICLVTLDDEAFIYLLSNCEYHEKENAVKSGTGSEKQSGSGTGRKLDTGTTTESDTGTSETVRERNQVKSGTKVPTHKSEKQPNKENGANPGSKTKIISGSDEKSKENGSKPGTQNIAESENEREVNSNPGAETKQGTKNDEEPGIQNEVESENENGKDSNPGAETKQDTENNEEPGKQNKIKSKNENDRDLNADVETKQDTENNEEPGKQKKGKSKTENNKDSKTGAKTNQGIENNEEPGKQNEAESENENDKDVNTGAKTKEGTENDKKSRSRRKSDRGINSGTDRESGIESGTGTEQRQKCEDDRDDGTDNDKKTQHKSLELKVNEADEIPTKRDNSDLEEELKTSDSRLQNGHADQEESIKSNEDTKRKLNDDHKIPKKKKRKNIIKNTSSSQNEKLVNNTETTVKKPEETQEVCVICIETIKNPKTLEKCHHTFCKKCINDCFRQFKPVCPTCNMVYGVVRGTQPEGRMDITHNRACHLPGYEKYGTIIIDYRIKDGWQSKEHPNPGERYHGTRRTAYLPDNSEGQEICRLLEVAFDRRLIFTIGRSTTTGCENVVTWNDVHHKTRIDGGPTRFGYPDPQYLSRVREELASKGVTTEDLTSRSK